MLKTQSYTAGGSEYVFRLPQMKDLIRLNDSLPLLPGTPKVEDESPEAAKEAFRKMVRDKKQLLRLLERADALLCVVSLKPKLVAEAKLEHPEGEASVLELKDQDKIFIYLSLLGLSGYNDEAAVELGPLSKTEASSRGSTASASDTVNVQASSAAGG